MKLKFNFNFVFYKFNFLIIFSNFSSPPLSSICSPPSVVPSETASGCAPKCPSKQLPTGERSSGRLSCALPGFHVPGGKWRPSEFLVNFDDFPADHHELVGPTDPVELFPPAGNHHCDEETQQEGHCGNCI